MCLHTGSSRFMPVFFVWQQHPWCQAGLHSAQHARKPFWIPSTFLQFYAKTSQKNCEEVLWVIPTNTNYFQSSTLFVNSRCIKASLRETWQNHGRTDKSFSRVDSVLAVLDSETNKFWTNPAWASVYIAKAGRWPWGVHSYAASFCWFLEDENDELKSTWAACHSETEGRPWDGGTALDFSGNPWCDDESMWGCPCLS